MNKRNYILKKFAHVPDRLQLVCLGTTQGHYAFDFTDSPIRAFNMSLCLNPPVFNRMLLEKYRKKIQKGAIIIITLEYPLLCIDAFERIAKENARQYARVLFGRNPYLSLPQQIRAFVRPERFDKQSQSIFEAGRLGRRNRNLNHFKPWELEEICRRLINDGWEREIEIKGFVAEGHLTRQPKAEAAMKTAVSEVGGLVEYCKDCGYIPVLLGLPYSGVLNEFVPDSFKEKCFYKNIERIRERSSCEFLDYSMDERLQNINYYMDVWFMNERGRKKFTEIVLQDIRLLKEAGI